VDATEHQYPSGEARADLFAAVGALLYGGLLLWTSPDMRTVAIAFLAFAAYSVWRAARAWRKPYVQLSGDRFVVYHRGQPRHYVDLTAVASLRPGFNRTVLLMRDGTKLSISHWGFLLSDDARHFRQALTERIEKNC